MEAWRKPRNDFKSDPSLSIVYQIAETLGWSREQVREQLSMQEFWEWAVYLNSPFSNRTRDAMMNGWIVHCIDRKMAGKGKRPKFADALFPFHKMADAYFEKPEKGAKGKKSVPKIARQHKSWVWRKKYEKALADYNAGRIPNAYGLYKGETVKRSSKRREV